jgi:hypothetical protein
MDRLVPVLWIGAISMGLGTLCLAFIGFRSNASPTLVLATATMVSAVAFFALHLLFALSPTESVSVFGAEVTIDHSQPGIWYSKKHGDDIFGRSIEYHVGKWLAQHKSELFSRRAGEDVLDNTNTDKIARDLSLYSVLVYMALNEPAWNLNTVTLRTKEGTVRQRPQGPSGKDCTNLDEAKIQSLLSNAGNVFAGAEPAAFSHLSVVPLCLPPETRISLTASDLILENPFCRISLHLEEPTVSVSMSNVEPGSGAVLTPLKNGQGRFESRLIGVRVHVRHSALRSQHADSAKYRAWSERLVRGVQRWFEGVQEPA